MKTIINPFSIFEMIHLKLQKLLRKITWHEKWSLDCLTDVQASKLYIPFQMRFPPLLQLRMVFLFPIHLQCPLFLVQQYIEYYWILIFYFMNHEKRCVWKLSNNNFFENIGSVKLFHKFHKRCHDILLRRNFHTCILYNVPDFYVPKTSFSFISQ